MDKNLKVTRYKGMGKVAKKSWFNIIIKERVYYTDKGQPIIAPAICVTTQAEMLTIHKKNRKINNGHAAKILASINTLAAILRQVVVVKYQEEYYIADGQHLYNGLKMASLPIEFILCEVDTEKQLIDFMRLMNDSAKRWGLNQFINVNTTNKVTNAYNKLVSYINDYKDSAGMTDKVMAAMMYNEFLYNEGASSNAIKGGYFVQNVPDVRLKMRLTALKRFYRKTNMTATNYLNAALVILMYEKKDNYFKNEKQFLNEVYKQAEKRGLLNLKYGNKRDALEFLGDCWARI
jgi:hypothetical protein